MSRITRSSSATKTNTYFCASKEVLYMTPEKSRKELLATIASWVCGIGIILGLATVFGLFIGH